MSSTSCMFPDENGLMPHYAADSNNTMRSCNCCPYGYHIDLDFVRYCEALANSNPSEHELQRRHNRRSRKSMEFMLGVDNLSLDQWDTTLLPQVHQDNNVPCSTPGPIFVSSPPSMSSRPRSASVPRFTYHINTTRPESPFGTASSTCSSMLGAESDIPFSLYQRRQRKNQQHPAETHAFLRDALEDVCSDFERTLERTSGRKKKHNVQLIDGPLTKLSFGYDDCNNNRNNNINTSNISYYYKKHETFESVKRTANTVWERKFDFLDSCLAGNKSPRSSRAFNRSNTLPYIQQKTTAAEQKYEQHVKATVAANSTSPVDEQVQQLVPPPPPPRRHNLHKLQMSDTDSTLEQTNQNQYTMTVAEKNMQDIAKAADAQTLYSIRQQMALSLSRMRDLEEQVKTIPVLQHELQRLREQKRRLELERPTRLSDTPSPLTSPKYVSPVQFAPQHITSVSLESLGARLRSSSSSSSDRKSRSVLKRDVGTNCIQPRKRDVAVGNSIINTRSVSTDPAQKLHITENLFTKTDIERSVNLALNKHKEQSLLNRANKATQMFKQWDAFSNVATQTNHETIVKHSGVMCKPTTRSVATSDHSILDILCEKCAVKKCHIACGTDDNEQRNSWVSLKTLDTPYIRSNTFSLGEQERLNLQIRKSIGTQCCMPTESVNAFSQTINKTMMSVSVQHNPRCQDNSAQTNIEHMDQKTDTKGLIKLCISETNTDEIAMPSLVKEMPILKPFTIHKSCNTERIFTRDRGENTISLTSVRHAGSNTDMITKRDMACGDIIKPHISIACAENYCDSCKDTIKHLAKDFSKIQTLMSPIPQRASESRIPRPKQLNSPSPVRKQIYRQNTYTITPSPTPSPVADKKTLPSSLPSSFYREKSASELKSLRNENNSKRQVKNIINSNSSETMNKSMSSVTKAEETQYSMDEPLIVREEKRINICWSREASPLPTAIDNSESKSIQTSINERMQQESNTQVNETMQSSQFSQTQTAATAAKAAVEQNYIISNEVSSAMKQLNESLVMKIGAKLLSSSSLKASKAIVQQEWFRVSSTDQANAVEVQAFLKSIEIMSQQLVSHCINLKDSNGNTALHYAVSHGNFDIVCILLDTKVCDVNQVNNAGYTSVMLVSLAKLKNSNHRAVVERLFQMADINIRAKKHCQTALMLAVSHGNLDMVEMLLAAGADINVQDEDGSTALMCAAEHGRVDIVKRLLSHTDCNSLIQDIDGSTAFKIAWQGGYRDIGLLLYVHEQMLRSKIPQHADKKPLAQS